MNLHKLHTVTQKKREHLEQTVKKVQEKSLFSYYYVESSKFVRYVGTGTREGGTSLNERNTGKRGSYFNTVT